MRMMLTRRWGNCVNDDGDDVVMMMVIMAWKGKEEKVMQTQLIPILLWTFYHLRCNIFNFQCIDFISFWIRQFLVCLISKSSVIYIFKCVGDKARTVAASQYSLISNAIIFSVYVFVRGCHFKKPPFASNYQTKYIFCILCVSDVFWFLREMGLIDRNQWNWSRKY